MPSRLFTWMRPSRCVCPAGTRSITEFLARVILQKLHCPENSLAQLCHDFGMILDYQNGVRPNVWLITTLKASQSQ